MASRAGRNVTNNMRWNKTMLGRAKLDNKRGMTLPWLLVDSVDVFYLAFMYSKRAFCPFSCQAYSTVDIFSQSPL